MKTISCICLLAVFSFSAVFGEKVNYNGQQVIQVVPKSAKSMQVLQKLEKQGLIKFWNEPSSLNRAASFQISANMYQQLSTLLTEHNLNPSLLISDIQELIEKQDRAIVQRKLSQTNQKAAFDFENFHHYSELIGYMKETAANNSLVTYSVIGNSYNGIEIGQAMIQTGGNAKQSIFLECGIHAREWVSPATCIWIFDQLANGYGTDAEITTLLNKFDWIIVPSSNPDGYEYTWTTDRLWRKNRAPTNNPLCSGIDLNRNYDANFGGDGSSDLACSETYHGPSAFSESESAAIRDSLEANRGKVKAYVSIHSYAQLWMSPYGYLNQLPNEYSEMYRVMSIGVAAIAATPNGTVFEYGNEAALLYLTSGTSRDYTYVGQGILYPYTIEARSESYGFVAPPEDIKITALEIWNGIKAMANAVV